MCRTNLGLEGTIWASDVVRMVENDKNAQQYSVLGELKIPQTVEYGSMFNRKPSVQN